MRKRIRRAKELRNWKRVVEKIAEAAKEELGDEVRVYIFGSAVRGELTASSDVDILICSPNVPDDEAGVWELKKRILERAGLTLRSPLQLHLVDDEGERFYLEALKVEAIRIR